MMQERLNKVIGTFTACFGLSPDVIFYEKGSIRAFRIFGRKNAIITIIAEEQENGHVLCKAQVKKYNEKN
jgi:hypothetical protein